MVERRLVLIQGHHRHAQAQDTKLSHLIKVGFRPLSREELALIPTAWVYRPRLVNFSTSIVMITHTTARKKGVGTGIPGMKPPK